jgi:hypothetical protein
MSREAHVRFCEDVGVQFPWVTRFVRSPYCLQVFYKFSYTNN